MTSFLFKYLKPVAKKGWILTGLILVALFNLIFFPQFSKFFGVIPNLDYTLDLKFYYSSDMVYDILQHLGEKGRKVYRASEIFVDFPYLIMYTALYAAVIIRLTELLGLKDKKYLIWAPLLLGISDAFENIGIINMIGNYPERMDRLAIVTSAFTSLKWIFASLTLLVILTLAMRWFSRPKN